MKLLKGIYLLILRIRKNTEIKVGSLGSIVFQRGYFIYVGSAQNNLIKRVQRHLSNDKKIRWHIDYLTTAENVDVVRVLYRESQKYAECETASTIVKTAEAVPGFGSSDCRCSSHLFWSGLKNGISFKGFSELEIEKISAQE